MQTSDNILPTETTQKVDSKTFYLGGLFTCALLTICYLAADLIMPIVLALTLKLVFQPVMRFLQRFGLPRVLAALLIILGLLFSLVGMGAALSLPASSWAQKLPLPCHNLNKNYPASNHRSKSFKIFCIARRASQLLQRQVTHPPKLWWCKMVTASAAACSKAPAILPAPC